MSLRFFLFWKGGECQAIFSLFIHIHSCLCLSLQLVFLPSAGTAFLLIIIFLSNVSAPPATDTPFRGRKEMNPQTPATDAGNS